MLLYNRSMNNDENSNLPGVGAVSENDCLDPETGLPRRSPDEVVPEITEEECETLTYNTGLSGGELKNCPDLKLMICDLKQEVDALNVKDSIIIAANDESKCADDSLPTLASIFSRVLRYSKAVTCILCGYDPRLATILKTGRYPQILMGPQQQGGYPQWVSADDYPTEESPKPVTSAGVFQAIQDTLLSAWHLWEEYPQFTYFAQVLSGSENGLEEQSKTTPPAEGDTALVTFDGTDYNVQYTYQGGKWVKTKVFEVGVEHEDKLVNFAVTHIVKGYYADKGVYFFDDGTKGTWQVMDVELGDLEKQVEELRKIYATLVGSADGSTAYLLATAPTLAAAKAVPCTDGKTTLTLITG